jgi:hypothetical protein
VSGPSSAQSGSPLGSAAAAAAAELGLAGDCFVFVTGGGGMQQVRLGWLNLVYGAIPIPLSVREIGGPAHITVGIFVFSFLLFFRVFDSTLVFLFSDFLSPVSVSL